MLTLLLGALGYWLVWFSYNMSVERGKHRKPRYAYRVRDREMGAHRRQGYNWRIAITEIGRRRAVSEVSLGWGWA